MIKKIFKSLRKIILVILIIGLPIFIYFGFIADEPVFESAYDVEIGRQSVASISQDSIEYPILLRGDYPEAYAFMQNMVNKIAASPEVQYADIFKYDSVQIIHRDDVLNAFCTPGGYVYVYTGLIHYLDRADDLAGVLGHEIAHAELRHSAIRLQKEYGRDGIMDFLLVRGVGLSGLIKAKILKDMLTLNYSRDQEADADRYSVVYLKDTDYACNGAAGFFDKLVGAGQDGDIPEFLSDHPDSASRIKDINNEAKEYGCNTDSGDQSGWDAFKSSLPQPVIVNSESEAQLGEAPPQTMEESAADE
ncbi:MAG: M48 family metalloprotease [Flavobacteriaceae bacterium]